MNSVIDIPTSMMHHRRHARCITALMSSLLSGAPVIGIQAQQAQRFLEGLAVAINADPSICSKIEDGAKAIR